MENLGHELNLWRLIRVFFCKLNRQVKAATIPDGVFGAEDYSFPLKERVATWRGLYRLLRRIYDQFLEVLPEATFRV